LDESSTQYFNVVGYYPLIRMAINNSQGFGAQATATVSGGVVQYITVTNPGQGYVAPPKVQILGNGSGADAIVTGIGSTGGIAGIQMISGGSGYLPLQYQGTVCAQVLITTGWITNLQYR
jgi:hypothetical protein